MITNLDFPWRKVFNVDLYPRVYLPLFITRASLELILSFDFFYNNRRETQIQCKGNWCLKYIPASFREFSEIV
jgi:hypothetical protein